MKRTYTIDWINDGTWRLTDEFQTRHYLLEGRNCALLIDTGVGYGPLVETVAGLTEKPVTVLLTHGHFDHAGGISQFTHISMHDDDLLVLVESLGEGYLRPRLKRFSEETNIPISEEQIDEAVNRPMPASISTVRDGDVIDLGGRSLRIISTPGHTPGSICILDQSSGELFCGDTVCLEGVLLAAPGSLSFETYLNSLQKLLGFRDSVKAIWAGHNNGPFGLCVVDAYIQCITDIVNNHDGDRKVMESGRIRYQKGGVALTYWNPDQWRVQHA